MIFLDIGMPIQDGETTAKNLREMMSLNSIDTAIIAWSGYVEEDEI